jgi:hypothetical protein
MLFLVGKGLKLQDIFDTLGIGDLMDKGFWWVERILTEICRTSSGNCKGLSHRVDRISA